MNKEKFTLRAECVCYFLDHRAEYLWGDAIETIAISYNAYTTHLHGTWREENTLVRRGKEALRARFAAEEHYRVIRSPCGL